MTLAELDTAYRTTRYVADLPDGEISLKVGLHSLDLDVVLEKHCVRSWAFITAWNPFSKQLPEADNAFRHLQLLEAISGYEAYPGRGVPQDGDWPPEESLLILGLSRKQAIDIGKMFGQNAIVWGEQGEPAQLIWIERFAAPVTVLHIPHSSYTIPADVRTQFLHDEPTLRREQLTIVDAYTDELFALPSEKACTVRFPVSRLVVDPERFEDDNLEIMASRGFGVIYNQAPTGGRLRYSPSIQEREDLLQRYYRPHHRQLTDSVKASLQEHDYCLLIDCHSFPEMPLPMELDQNPNRPDICLGTDAFHTPEWLVQKAKRLFEERGYKVEVDHPFSGVLVPMQFYHQQKTVLALMIELNRKLYMNERTGAKSSRFIRLQHDIKTVLLALVE